MTEADMNNINRFLKFEKTVIPNSRVEIIQYGRTRSFTYDRIEFRLIRNEVFIHIKSEPWNNGEGEEEVVLNIAFIEYIGPDIVKDSKFREITINFEVSGDYSKCPFCKRVPIIECGINDNPGYYMIGHSDRCFLNVSHDQAKTYERKDHLVRAWETSFNTENQQEDVK